MFGEPRRLASLSMMKSIQLTLATMMTPMSCAARVALITMLIGPILQQQSQKLDKKLISSVPDFSSWLEERNRLFGDSRTHLPQTPTQCQCAHLGKVLAVPTTLSTSTHLLMMEPSM